MLRVNEPTRILKVLASSLFCVLLLCSGVRAQEANPQTRGRGNTPREAAQEVSTLEKGNLSRVAASATQVKEVLLKEPGILVELKRWVAKEASQNGQIIDDDSLSDQSIFDRLDTDIAFRSAATRLVQKYGYLLPSVNPDSPIAKEQDLILKERARRLVQIESQEDAQSLQPSYEGREIQTQGQENQRKKLLGAACVQGRDPECDFLENDQDGVIKQDNREIPGNGTPYPRDSIPQSDPRLMRTRTQMQDSDQVSYPGGMSTPGMSSDVTSRAQGALEVAMRYGGENGGNVMSPLAPNSNKEAIDAALNSQSLRSNGNLGSDRDSSTQSHVVRYHRNYRFSSRDIPSVSMVHKLNPYADVPSLYDMYVQAAVSDRKPERFGLEVFKNGTRDLNAIPMDTPVGPEYVVGPGDGLAINLWGGISGRLTRVVDRQGRINLPESGPLLVSGRSLGDVQNAVEQVLRTQYRDTSADVSLARLRTVRVYVVGEVEQPGAYDVSSLSTPMSALFEAGGITPRGSLRRVQHMRGKQLIEEVDAYDLLLHGVNLDAKRLENGDSLLVPSLGPEVIVTGMVRRPAIYELHSEATLEDVLELAGGVLQAATLKHIEVQRIVEHEKRTMLSLAVPADDNPQNTAKQLAGFKIQAGDEIHIFPIAPYNESIVYLQGHVLRPGKYSYREGMNLKDLLASYTDLLPEPAAHYAEIIRLNPPDFRPSVESFDLSQAMSDPATSPKLQAMDTVRVFSRFEFEAPPEISVEGDVRAPGVYRLSGQAHLRDAVYLAGGIADDASLESAQLFHRESDGTMTIASVNLAAALSGNSAANVILSPQDRLLIHHNLSLSDPPTVSIKGEVAKPGKYPLTSNMHLEDLIQVAGGLKRSADSQSVDLTRYAEGNAPGIVTRSINVPLAPVLQGDSQKNLQLKDGDVLTVRQITAWNDVGASVAIRGEVTNAGTYGIHPGERLSSVLQRAGGLGANAYPYGAVLMRREVREIQTKSHLEIIERLKIEETHLKTLPENDADQRNAKLTAIGQSESALASLQANQPIGRVVIHIRADEKEWKNSQWDVPLRDGDVLVVPKKANFVMITGQVFNPTAVSYRSGQSAKWYLSQAGGFTAVADKSAVFVVRADGSVIAAKNNSGGGFWAGDPLNTPLKAGDTIVVPERGLKVGSRNWQTFFQAAQLASSIALTVAYIHP